MACDPTYGIEPFVAIMRLGKDYELPFSASVFICFDLSFQVDYMTDSSSDEEKLSEDDREQIYQEQGVDEEAGLKALLTDMSKSTFH